MSDIVCRECGVSRTEWEWREWDLGDREGPNKDVDVSCDTCGLSLLWAVWAGLVDIHPRYLTSVLSAHFAGLINRDPEAEADMVCDTCGAMDRTCFDCAPEEKRARWTALLTELDAMNYE
jgi:hypothetical protein